MRTSQRVRPETARVYLECVNRAIDAIVIGLAQPIRLGRIAREAGFSPYHFHRVFQSLVGETPEVFVNRLRLEKALTCMMLAPKRPLTQVALDCGFGSSSNFSRRFKQRYGVPPRAFDLDEWRQLQGDRFDAIVSGVPRARHVRAILPKKHTSGFQAAIRRIPPREVAYVRVDRPYESGAVVEASARLVQWAEEHGFADRAWLGYQWENPEIVPLERCRYYVAVEATGFRSRGEVGRFRFPSMTVAEVEVRGSIEVEIEALRWLYGSWLARSGFLPDDHPGFEVWKGRPFEHGVEHFELSIQLPIRRM